MSDFRGSGARQGETKPGARMSAGTVTRRSAIAVLAGWSVLSTATAMRGEEPARPRARPPSTPLGELAARSGMLFGASVGRNAVEIPEYSEIYRKHARVLTSDLAMKMAFLRPGPGEPAYAEADLLVDFAARNQMAFRGHTLIWNENNPGWMKSLTPGGVGALLDKHVEETVGRYAGRIHSWDVVNEPFWPDHRALGFYRKGLWFDALGPNYISRALWRASKADPAAKLVINEAFTERGDGLGLEVRRRMLRLIDDLQHAGVPLHAIGLEAHLQPQFLSDDTGFQIFLDEIARRKLDIYITELDIDDVSFPADPDTRDQMAADRVYDFLTRALSCPAVKVLECWQLSDRFSWYSDPALAGRRGDGGKPRPLPFDSKMAQKPMYDAIARALDARVA